MLVTYLLARRTPRYAVPLVLLIGDGNRFFSGQLKIPQVSFELTMPVWVTPKPFTWQAMVSLAIPLFIVTMASQNLPGVAAIRAANYSVPISKIITFTGVATLLLAPFGAFALNLSAITASICMGREAHAVNRRYTAAVWCGVIYCVIGLFGAAVAGVLAAFPRELVSAIAGLALLGSIGGGLATGMKDESHRKAALVYFLVTLSGVSLWGIGSAFWGVVAGALALGVNQLGKK